MRQGYDREFSRAIIGVICREDRTRVQALRAFIRGIIEAK